MKVVDTGGKAVCMITPRAGVWNGDVLAAAPDLLAELKNAADLLESVRRHDPDCVYTAGAKSARATIAKAERRT